MGRTGTLGAFPGHRGWSQSHLKLAEDPADMWVMQERRSEVRMMCADMVEVAWKDLEGRTRNSVALLEDISASGVCLQLEGPVPLGTEIRWDSPRQKFCGQVRYCVYREIGYFVGVELSGASRWSKRSYKPRHMLDLSKLVAQASR